MTALKNRHKLMLLAALLMFCVLLSSPAIASTSQSVLQDVSPLPTDRTWISADLPEGAVVLNNLEDYVDQLSDLHNESDIGTHSNPAAMRFLDAVYNTLTSDNITIPEQTIYDPENGTLLYNQSAYESWGLDLEGGWTNVDHDEISAELCVFGGTQAEESLRVDIWDNAGWINVIPDVMPGWNNVSIAPSLVDETLEIRFTGSDTGNTSIQNSWDIDAVLLHTWTTVYGIELTSHGLIQDLGNNLSRYIASVGACNTWDEVSGTWHRYLYDPETRTVKIGNLTISHLVGGALSIDGDAGSRVGKLSWYIQAHYNDIWNNITLGNYQFVGFTRTADNVTVHQRFWGIQGEMNVYLTYSYFGGFKTRVDIRNDAAQAVPIRAIWAARDIRGIQDNYELLRDENDVLYGIQIEDATFSWYDVLISGNPLQIRTVVDKPNRRAAVIFGNRSTIIPSGYTATIDPTYAVGADADDNYWNTWEAPVRYDGATDNKIQTDGVTYTYVTTFRMALTIIPYSTVTQASLSVYVSAESGSNSVTIKRINALSAAVLEGGSYPSIDSSPTGTVLIAATGWKTSDDIGDLVQEQINQAGWTGSSQYMGFKLEPTGVCGHTIHDYQKGAQPPYLTVTFEEPSANWLAGYAYRQGHSIDGGTGAGTYYQVKIAVEYASGTSNAGTIYCNSHCQTDFDDIRFTDNDGQTELDYWMEEKTDSDDATFWVEVIDDLGSDRIIYCYYGKAVSTTSSGANTFLFYEDWASQSWAAARWIDHSHGTGGSTSYTSYYVSAATHGYIAKIEGGTENGGIGKGSTYGPSAPYSTMGRVYIQLTAAAYQRIYVSAGFTNASAYSTWMSREGLEKFSVTDDDGNADEITVAQGYYNSWQTFQISRSGPQSKLWFNHAVVYTKDSNPDTEPNEAVYLYVRDTEYDLYADWVAVRKFVATEPVNYNWGREQPIPNNPPTVEPQPNIAVLDDTDNLYSRYRKYEVTTYYKDLDGFADIDYVQLYFYNEPRTTLYFYGRFDQDTHVFSEQGTTTQKSYWALDTGGSTYSEHDTDYLDVTWKFYVEWVCPDVVNLDVRCYAIDDEPESASLYYDYLWDGSSNRDCDIETDLDWSSVPAVTDDDAGTADRGDLNEVFTMEGTLKYQGSALIPPDAEVDVWVAASEYGSNVGPWSDTLGASGTWSVTCYADNLVGQDTYTMKPVANGAGSGGSSLYYTTDLTDTYIADRAEIYSIVAPDDHVGAGTGTTIQYYIRYDYLNQAGITGTFYTDTTNDQLIYQSGNQWDATVNEAFGVYTFNGFTTCSESQHGLTGWTFTGSDESIDFDIVRALEIEVSDDRCNYGSDQWIRVRFDYQSASYGYVTSWSTYPTVTGPNGAITLNIDDGSGWWRGSTGTYSSIARHYYNTNTLNNYVDADSVLSRSKGAYTEYTIWDRANLTLISNLGWTIIDYNTTLSAIGVFEYDGDPWSGVATWTDQFPSESTVGTYDYGAAMLSSITDPDYDVTVFAVGEEATVIFDDIVPSGSVDYYWTTPVSPNLDSVNLIWGAGSNWMWDYNDTLLNVAVIFTSFSNGSAPSGSGGTYGSGAFGGLTTGLYNGIVWNYVEFSINTTVTIAGIPYDWEIWSAGMTVVVPHSLTTSVWFFYKDGDYYQLLMHTNYENASVMVWDDMEVGGGYDDSIYYGDYEGMHEWLRDTTVGTHNCTILLNAGGDKGAVERNYVTNDLRLWYNFTYAIAEPTAYDCHIVILNNLYELIPFDTFEVYKNGTRVWHDIIRVTDGYGYQIEVKNRFGDTVNSTAFGADREMVVFVNVYSLKFMSWYDGFCEVNISRSGVSYTEIIMPLEIVNFRLYSAQYIYVIDYLNGTVSAEYNINLTNSTGAIITGNTIADIMAMSEELWDLVYNVNVTITATNNYVLTISIDLENINTTIGYQLVQVLLNITNTNTTIYSQVVDLLAYLQNVNSTLFDQTVDIIIELNYISSNVTAGFISVSAELSAIDSNLYSNFTSVAAQLLLIDSNLLSNFTEVSAALLAIDSSLLSNFTYVMANLTAIGSNITANYLSVSAALSTIDSSLLSNFTSIAAYLTLIDSNMLSNFTELTASLTAIGSNVTSNYLSVAAMLSLIDSNLYSNFTSITSTLTAMGSNITTNYLAITAELALIDSSLAANFTTMMTKLIATNSSLFIQTLAIISDLEFLNATMYLIDDPTHLNPLVLGYSLSDDYCDFTIVSTWHNATLSFYDNDVLRAGPTSELLCPIRYPLLATSGTHNLSVYVDGGNDSFWYNISYTVAEIIAFELEDWDVIPLFGVESYLILSFDTTWGNSTTYVYLNGSLQTSIPEQAGGVSSVLWMSGISGLHNYVFNVTSGTNVITITWDFYLPDWAETALVVRWDLWTFQDNYTTLELGSNWMNCTYYVYLNSSLVATSANDPVTLNFTRAINIGEYNLTIFADGGAQTYTIKNIRYIITEEGVSYDFSTVSGGYSVIHRDTYEGDIYEGDTHENPPGIYMTAETAATIAVSTVFIFFLAVLFMNSRVKKAQLDIDKKGNQ